MRLTRYPKPNYYKDFREMSNGILSTYQAYDSSYISTYIEAIYFTLSDEDDPTDNSREFQRRCKKDCDRFMEKAEATLEAFADDSSDRTLRKHEIQKIIDDAMSDFWLSRSRSGAGFFDGDWDLVIDGQSVDKYGKKLEAIAKSFGELDPYVGDDGYLYF